MKITKKTVLRMCKRWMASAMAVAAVLLTLQAGSISLSAAEGDGKKISELGIENGIYTMGVTLDGGWVGSEITTPARVRIKDGEMTALIEWDSIYYTSMTVAGKQIAEEEKRDGNSKFVIPVAKTDAPIDVSVIKTEFGQSMQTNCTLTFHSAEIKKSKSAFNPGFATASAGFAFFGILGLAAVVLLFLHRKLKSWG